MVGGIPGICIQREEDKVIDESTPGWTEHSNGAKSRPMTREEAAEIDRASAAGVEQVRAGKGGIKLDKGKPPVMRGCFMRFPRAMVEVARVSQVGTTKYEVPITDMQYAKVEDGYGRYTDAAGRHYLAEAIHGQRSVEKGGALPPDGAELIHAAQAAWDSLARLEILLIEREKAGLWSFDT